MKRLAVALLALLVAGCSFTRSEPVVYHVLRDPGPAAPGLAARPPSGILLVSATATESFYDTTSIAFSRSEGTRGYYQFALWTERPGQAFTRLLIDRLEGARLYATVAPATAGVKGDLELHTELIAIYHDVTAPPGVARVRLTASLVDRHGRRLLARASFEREAPAAAYSADGAMQGFNVAVGGVLDDVVSWLRTAPGRTQ